MRLRDLQEIKNSTSGHATWARTAVEPKTLDTIYNIQAYDREKAAAKDAREKAKSQAVRDQRRAGNEPPPLRVSLHNFSIDADRVEHYKQTNDKAYALDIAKKWGTRSMPPQLLAALYDDPEWQKIVLDLWKWAVKILDNIQIGGRLSPGYYTKGGYLGRESTELEGVVRERSRDLLRLIQKYQAQFNIDKHGNRLPTR
jgi:hypothetical protein